MFHRRFQGGQAGQAVKRLSITRALHSRRHPSNSQHGLRSVKQDTNVLLHRRFGRRTLFDGVSPFIIVPSVFVGLLLGHWIHKCFLMVLFQNKIIYMPSLPPGSRREKLQDYTKSWGSVVWEERKIKSLDGTKLTLAVAHPRQEQRLNQGVKSQRKRRIILYFQGNGASIPPRTPMLSNILRSVAFESEDEW